MVQPTVAVNIPTYNQQAFIVRAVNSALLQDYCSLKVTVLDDASPDDTQKVLSSVIDEKLTACRNSVNLGRVKTYHKLLFELSGADWCVNLDGDDYFANMQFVKEGMKWITKLESDNIVFFQANHKNISAVAALQTARQLDENTYLADGMDYLKHYHKIRSFDHFATIYNRSEAIKANFYSFDSINTDFNSIMKLCAHGNIIVSAMRVGEWNYNPASETNKVLEKQHYEAYLAAVKDLVDYVSVKLTEKESAQLLRNLLRLSRHYLFMIAAANKNVKAAKSIFMDNIHFSEIAVRDFLKLSRLSLSSIFAKK